MNEEENKPNESVVENNVNQTQNNQGPNEPKKSGHAGAIIAGVVIVALIICAIVVTVLLINKDEDSDSDKKSSKKENTTNSLVEKDEDEDEDEDEEEEKDEDEDEDEAEEKDSKRSKIETVEANGVKFLADYSAFAITAEDAKSYLEDNMVDKTQKLKKQNNKYELELNQGVGCTITVDDNGYVKELDFVKDVSAESEEDGEAALDSGYQLGYIFGAFLAKLGYTDLTDIQSGIVAISSETSEKMSFDETKGFPQEMYNNYKIVNHTKLHMTMDALSNTKLQVHYKILTDKKETGSKY